MTKKIIKSLKKKRPANENLRCNEKEKTKQQRIREIFDTSI